MPTGAILGASCKLYYDSVASYASPTWKLVDLCMDLTLNNEKGTAEISIRGSIYKLYLGALKDAGVDFGMLYDTGNAAFQAFKAAYINNTFINCAVMDGTVTVAGSEGLEGPFTVTKFQRNEQREEAVTVDVSIKPAYYPGYAPSWLVVT